MVFFVYTRKQLQNKTMSKNNSVLYFNENTSQFWRVFNLDKSQCVLIYDKKLMKSWSRFIRQWPRSYGVSSGEKLKDLHQFPRHASNILKQAAGVPHQHLAIVSFGGGSVGDFSGFVASVFKRGVQLVHIPSTWLAAIDSAHGGKTALNIGSYKNQIGTFHPAQKIFLVRDILFSQPVAREKDAAGEVVKMALLSGGSLFRQLNRHTRPLRAKDFWQSLPAMIAAKNKIVKRDPQETKGIRHLLNLGHTLGHVIEINHKISHGQAVAYGLGFALEFSEHMGLLKDLNLMKEPLFKYNVPDWKKLKSIRNLEQHLLQDKKLSKAGMIRFVFIQRSGHCHVKPVAVREIVNFVKREGL